MVKTIDSFKESLKGLEIRPDGVAEKGGSTNEALTLYESILKESVKES